METLWTILSSAVVAAIVSSIASYIINILTHKREYKDDYYKMVIAKRIDAYQYIEKQIAVLKFVVVDDKAKLAEMADAAEGLGMNKFTHGVPVMVAVVLEKMNVSAKLGSLVKNKDYCMLDLGMAVEHFCLQAAELGLGTCIMGWFDEKRIAKLLDVPRGKRIPLIISLGHPDCPTRRKIRKSMEEISSWNSY